MKTASRALPDETFLDALTPDWGFYLRSSRCLADFRSDIQEVEVHDTATFGRLYRLDGHAMSSERDEYIYHELLTHPVAAVHNALANVLIIGGGDGGSARELLRYPSIKQITIVEIDQAVVELSRRYLASIHQGSLDHAKVKVIIEDGLAYLMRCNERYDLIVLDLTDPIGASLPLYTASFYRDCAAHLNPRGSLTLHLGSPFATPEAVKNALASLREIFRFVQPRLTSVPLWGGVWMMACCAQELDGQSVTAADLDARLAAYGIHDLKYYNGAIHHAALVMPNVIGRQMTEDRSQIE